MKKYKKGSSITISNKAYAHLYNSYLDKIGAKGTKRYSLEEAKEHDKIKGPRPTVVIWNHPFSDKVILAPQTTSRTPYNLNNGKKVSVEYKGNKKEVIWKYQFLIQKKDYIKSKIYKNHTKEEVRDFLDSWKKNKNNQRSFNELEKTILKLELKAQNEYIKHTKNEKDNK